MATYIKGVTDYIPVLEPFKPDYKFLSDVLTVREDRYDTNFKSLNNLYSKVVYAPLSREDNEDTRQQYANRLSNGLKQISGTDLSLQQNVDVAKGLFKPFFEDKSIVKDLAFTKMYAKEMQTANSYMTDPSEKQRDRYWQIGVQDLKYQMDDFKNGTSQEALSQGMPTYVENPNIYERSFEALKDSELSIKQTTLEGDWIITTKNGTALTRQIVGYEREVKGQDANGNPIYGDKYKLDDNNNPIPIYRNPAAEYLKNTVMKDPIVMRGLLTEAKVISRQFAENPENIQQYGSIENAKKAWADNILQTQTQKDIKELVEKESELTKETIAARNWEEYKKKYKIVPGSPEEEAWLLSQFNQRLAKQNRDAIKSRVMNQKGPTSDLNGLMNKAYSAYMASVMGPKMNAAAIAYSQVDAEQTFEANPFKKMEHQHRYDLNRMAIQHQYDLNKLAAKAAFDIELAKYKNTLENQNTGGNVLGLDNGGVFTEPGGAEISGSLTGVDLDGDDKISKSEMSHVDVLNENSEALVEIGNNLTTPEIGFIETLIKELPKEIQNSKYVNPGGTITYEYYDEGTGQTTTKTEPLTTAWKDLTQTNKTNRAEFDRILKNVSNKYTNIIKTEDGSQLNYDLAALNMQMETASDLHQQYKSVLEGRTRLNNKVEEMNSVYHQVHDYALVKDKEMQNSTSYQGQSNSIPPVLLTQGEIDLLRKGNQWWEVIEMRDNGDIVEPIVDGTGTAVRRFVTKEEYQSIFADMVGLDENERAQLNADTEINKDKHDYDFFLRKKRDYWIPVTGTDKEHITWRYWDDEYVPTTSGNEVMDMEDLDTAWEFNREKALEDGADYYDNLMKNMNSIMGQEDAPEMNLTYNLRGQLIGQPEEGVGEAGYTLYTTTYDVAAPSQVALNQIRSILEATQNLSPQVDGYTFSVGNNMDKTTTQITDGDDGVDNSQNANAKSIYKAIMQDINTGKLDKTDGRPYISTTYVEKAGGPDQETDIAAYNMRVGAEYSNIYKDYFGVGDKFDETAFEEFKKNGITITIPKTADNNPYKSGNQLLSYADLMIKDEGSYNSLPVLNGGEYTIYPNSKGQYIQETTTYLFDETTGGIRANDVTSIVLNVDANQLDALVVNMDMYLMELAKSNVNKKTLWTEKNSK